MTPIESRKGRRAAALAALVVALVAEAASGGEPGRPDPSAEVLVVRRCPIDYEQTATLGSPQYGVVQECQVEPGDRVKAGQILGRLRDDELRAEVRLREMEANSDIEVRLSEARSSSAKIKLSTTAMLLQRNAASREEFNLLKAEAEAANLAIEQARQNRELARERLRLAQAQLRTREFVSPHDGVVVAVLKRRGEPVAPNEPVFRVVGTDKLIVTAQVDVTDSWRLRVGQSVRVIPEIGGADLPLEREVFIGRVVFIDTHIDPLNQTCKVLVKVDNRGGLLRAGLEARIEIDPSAPAAADPKAPRPAGPPPGAATARLTGGAR